MAKGRMLNWAITESMKFHRLPDDTCRLMATWTISLLDAYGVFHADPVLVKSRVFPMRADISVETVAKYIDAMEAAGLIKRFEHDGRAYQYWPGFKLNQPKLHQEREGASGFPKPPECDSPKVNGARGGNPPTESAVEQLQSNSRVTPPQSNISQSNSIELGADAPSEIEVDFDNQTLTVADATQPTPQNNTSRTDEGIMDFLDMAFDRLEKQANNPDAKAEATIRRWNLPPHLADICVQFVKLAHVPVMLGDKGKWAKGARDLHELGAQTVLAEALKKGRKDGLTLTWPGALTELCREQIATKVPVKPTVIYVPEFN